MGGKRKSGRVARLKRSPAAQPVKRVVRVARRAARQGPKRIRKVLRRTRKQAANVWVRRLTGKRPIPPPHAYKISVVLDYAKRFGTRSLVETGTLRGDMIEGTRDAFDRLWSIELDPALQAAAARRFAAYPHISIVLGDSAIAMPNVIAGQPQPILFWLDGHWSGGVTGHADLDTPVSAELTTILARANDGDVILIDDARLFGTGDYPTVAAVRSVIKRARPGWRVENRDDIIRAHRVDEAKA